MMRSTGFSRAAAIFICGSLMMSSTAHAATALPSTAISPWTALSAFGTQASAAQLCATSTAATAAAAAQARPGCVLPVVDGVPPPVVNAAPPVPGYVPVASGGGLGISPLLLALGALAVVGVIALSHGDDDDDDDGGSASPF